MKLKFLFIGKTSTRNSVKNINFDKISFNKFKKNLPHFLLTFSEINKHFISIDRFWELFAEMHFFHFRSKRISKTKFAADDRWSSYLSNRHFSTFSLVNKHVTSFEDVIRKNDLFETKFEICSDLLCLNCNQTFRLVFIF